VVVVADNIFADKDAQIDALILKAEKLIRELGNSVGSMKSIYLGQGYAGQGGNDEQQRRSS
jgi:hypothetical protein